MAKEKLKHGGARPGAGAKKKEPTVTISFRVKVKWANHLKKLVKDEIIILSKK